MIAYVLRRLLHSALTIFGVMLVTFLLFRVIAGDMAAANLGQKATERQKAEWRYKHGYDLPLVVNLDHRLVLTDRTGRDGALTVREVSGSDVPEALALVLPGGEEASPGQEAQPPGKVLMGRYVFGLSPKTRIEKMTDGKPLAKPAKAAGAAPATAPATAPARRPAVLELRLSDGNSFRVDLAGVETCGQLLARVNEDPNNGGRVSAGISPWHLGDLFRSQFFHHLFTSATFQARSLQDNRKLTTIIAQRAPASLSITVPAMAVGWLSGLVVACFVAYYRGTMIDRIGVLLSVLGMCVPFLAFMIIGQQVMFLTAPRHAYGTFYRANVYVPVVIMVAAGLGGSVRFYRTVILDETNRDYVRTARAKGVPLAAILFKHVLKNCMLPILTNLIMAIPFLIMGSLLVETYFGIPGLGDLMLTSITNRNEPILSGLVFLTALIYTVGVLVTDLSYGLFDPRIRLQ